MPQWSISLRRTGVPWALALIGLMVVTACASAHSDTTAGQTPSGAANTAKTASTTTTTAPAGVPSPSGVRTSGSTPTSAPSFPRSGPGTYDVAGGQSAVFGTSGELWTYRVAVEKGGPVSADEFARVVDATLSDSRSWIAGKDVRLHRVSGPTAYRFTVYLVTAGTAQRLCLAGGYDIFWRGEPYTSCRVGGKVVINLSRYLTAVPGYGAPLGVYQQYAINHEVGHALGHDHELCPAKGKPAPVMQQQTFSLQGCVANGWPYLNGERYSGPPGRIAPPN